MSLECFFTCPLVVADLPIYISTIVSKQLLGNRQAWRHTTASKTPITHSMRPTTIYYWGRNDGKGEGLPNNFPDSESGAFRGTTIEHETGRVLAWRCPCTCAHLWQQPARGCFPPGSSSAQQYGHGNEHAAMRAKGAALAAKY